MAEARFSAVMTLPISAKGLIKSEKRGRSTTSIRPQGTSTNVKIDATDMSSFKATLNSVLRDLTVVEAVSKTAKKSRE